MNHGRIVEVHSIILSKLHWQSCQETLPVSV